MVKKTIMIIFFHGRYMIFVSYFSASFFLNPVKSVKKNTYTYCQNHVEVVIFGNIFAYGRGFIV